MTKFGIICLHRKRIRFAFGDCVPPEVIPERSVHIQCITKIPFGFGCLIYNSLHEGLGSFPFHFPAENAARFPIYKCNKVNSVFLSPINVKSSSNSAAFTSLGTGALGNCSACSLAQLATL